jgi:hypothetical protein
MSEEQPLLSQDDPESLNSKTDRGSWREATAHVLEHPILHKIVITLVSFFSTDIVTHHPSFKAELNYCLTDCP